MPTVSIVEVGDERFDTDSTVAWEHNIRWQITGYGIMASVHDWELSGPWGGVGLTGVSGWLFQRVVTEVAEGPGYNSWSKVSQSADYWEMWVVVRRGESRHRRRLVLPCQGCKTSDMFEEYDQPQTGVNDTFTVGHGVLDSQCRGYQDFRYRKTGHVYYVDWSKSKLTQVDAWLAGAQFNRGVWGYLPGKESAPGIAVSAAMTRVKTIHVTIQDSGRHTIAGVA